MTITDIKVEGVDLKGLAGIDIIEAAHAHGICELSFILPQKFDSAQMLQLDKKKLTVKANDDIIFCGIVNRCEVVGQIIGDFLIVTLLSLSCQMESAHKSKSYQSATKTFSTIADDIKHDYEPAEIDCWQNDTIAELVYRDNMTDWQFLKNLAERHGQILFVYTKTDKLKLSIGFKAFEKVLFLYPPKLVSRNLPMDFFLRLEQNTYEGARSSYFLETTIELSDLTVGVGCSVEYDNEDQAVIASHIYSKDNNLYNEVTLRHKEGCCADARDVLKHFDEFYYLSATVLEAQANAENLDDNFVKVQFDCDEEQNADEALKIPFESSVSNYLYTMPDKDEKVCVYVDSFRQAAMTALRTRAVDDEEVNRSFKIQNAAIVFDPNQFSFNAAEAAELKHEDGTQFNTTKNITFVSKGDIIIQSAQGQTADNQLTMAAATSAGYLQYTTKLGQPPTVQFNPEGSVVGKDDSAIKNAGSESEPVELSDLAKKLNAIANGDGGGGDGDGGGDDDGGGGGDGGGGDDGGDGGDLQLKGSKDAVMKVGDSFIAMKGSDYKVKASVLYSVAYNQMAGGGTGSLGKFEGGNPGNRSDKEINDVHASEDRKRINEDISATFINYTKIML